MDRAAMNRREALALMAAGVGAAACAPDGAPGEGGAAGSDGSGAAAGGGGDPAPIWAKDPSPFVQHGTNLETRLADLDGLITPNELFFVRNHAPTPIIDPATYVLAVGGPGAEREVQLTLDDLRALPSQTLIAYIECAGNWRGFFQSTTGRTASGSQWGTGAIGCAEWTGPSLADVLALAGVRDDALEVNVIGLDDGKSQVVFGCQQGRFCLVHKIPSGLSGSIPSSKGMWRRTLVTWYTEPNQLLKIARAVSPQVLSR